MGEFASHPDPDTCEKLRKLQSRVQVWVKPTDRILTDTDAYEFDRYQAGKQSGKISTQWAFFLLLFGTLAGVFTYYACFLAVSGQIDSYFMEKESKTLFSLLGFHLFMLPGFTILSGNLRVRKAMARIIGSCLLSLTLAGCWWALVFGDDRTGGLCVQRC